MDLRYGALLLLLAACSGDQQHDGTESLGQSVYYDWQSKKPLEVLDVQENGAHLKRVAFRSNGCSCQNLSCGCCFGLNVTQFAIDQLTCINLKYEPEESAIVFQMLMNEQTVFVNSVSARNPPPLCFPMPYVPVVQQCARFFDLTASEGNLHLCMDLETRFSGSPILVLHFDCMRMGSAGLELFKPTGVSLQTDTDITATTT